MNEEELREKVIAAVCFKPDISGHLEQFERIEQLVSDAIAADRKGREQASNARLRETRKECNCEHCRTLLDQG